VNDQGCVDILCPIFLKDIARAIVSAGKSFQLVQHVQDVHRIQTHKDTYASNLYQSTNCSSQEKFWTDTSSLRIQDGHPRSEDALEESTSQFGNDSREMGLLTLSEIFLICLSGLLENGDHVYEYLRRLHADSVPNNKAFVESESNVQETKDICVEGSTEKTWVKLLKNATSGRKYDGIEKTISRNTAMDKPILVPGDPQDASSNAVEAGRFTLSCYENPAITACREVLLRNPLKVFISLH
jgi:gamma-tubulin complex component 5